MPGDLNVPTYLGDGLYVSFDGEQFTLYSSDGVNVTNRVFLEPSVLVAFFRFAKSMGYEL